METLPALSLSLSLSIVAQQGGTLCDSFIKLSVVRLTGLCLPQQTALYFVPVM